MLSTERMIKRDLVDATTMIARGFIDLRLELSAVKCQITASCEWVGCEVAGALADFAFRFSRKVKSLGTGVGPTSSTPIGVDAVRTPRTCGRSPCNLP